jgi:coenzyme F420-0:L-glutamate ligase
MKVIPVKTQVLEEGCNIFSEILTSKITLIDNDVISITSKVIALSQKRTRVISEYGTTIKEAYENLIKEEADKIFPGKYILTLKNNILIPFAGIDASNTPKGKVILWPETPYKVAKELHKKLCSYFKINTLGVVITDSHCQPLRLGVTGLALAWYGFKGVEDERGKKDLFGNKLEVTQKAVADNLSSASILVQGEGNESTPFCVIKEAPVDFSAKDDFLHNSQIDPDEDIFKSILNL